MKRKLKLSAKVQKIAKVVRAEAMKMVKAGNYGNATGNGLGGGCGDISAVLVKVLQDHGVSAWFEAGQFEYNGHCWVRLYDGSILDLTATQFGKYPRVWNTRSPKYATDIQMSSQREISRRIDDWAGPKWRKELLKNVGKRLKKVK